MIRTTTDLPPRIEIRFHNLPGPRLQVSAQPAERAAPPIAVGSLPEMGAFLKDAGYTWITGSKGLWQRTPAH